MLVSALILFTVIHHSLHSITTLSLQLKSQKMLPFARSLDLATSMILLSLIMIERRAIESTVISDPDVGDYLMKISIGTPPIEVLAIADTGSDLIWIQCKPCDECYPQNSPIFDPLKSSSYQLLSCNSKPCSWLPIQSCNINTTNKCQYLYSYQDNSFTIGDLANETFTFPSISSTTNNGQFQGVFGCGHNNSGIFSNLTAGLVGLGWGPLSLISQLGSQIQYKFSYCLVPHGSNSTSKMKFGGDAVISGNGVVSTPLVSKLPNSTFYYITLEGISIGNKTVSAATMTAPVAAGNIVIDSGSTLTSLEPSFYNNFEGVIKEVVGLQPVQDSSGTYSLCYAAAAATAKLPEMVFHFTGADVPLKPLNTFVEIEDLVCLTISSSDSGGLSIFGNLAQMNFQVEYDLEGKMLSFAPVDCTTK